MILIISMFDFLIIVFTWYNFKGVIALTRRVLRGLLFALALGMIAVGVSRGENDLVMHKAITICLECIGIG